MTHGAYYNEFDPYAAALKFLSGRPHFHRPDGTRARGNSGGPIVLIAYGEYDARRLWDDSKLPGVTVAT